ncbi:protein arginine kinase [soil metagenome]
MSIPPSLINQAPHWIEEPAPFSGVVMSSRARYARNVADHLFAPHSQPSVLAQVREEVAEAISNNPFFEPFHCLEMTEVTGAERTFLKEARLISKEMERGGASRAVYVAPDFKCSIMVNEEDHLRLQCLEPGLQISRVQETLAKMEEELGAVLRFAFHDQLGYLTACPTNVGTGLRVSVMMHLPGLTLQREVEAAMAGLAKMGLTSRGFHGENSENTGDFYQVSNEVTLGEPVAEIEEKLRQVASAILEREREARSLLISKGGIAVQDAVWRSFGVLANARKIDSGEAMKLLSRVRLGIDEGYFGDLSHEKMNQLILDIQPGHLIFRHGAHDQPEDRDSQRATLIRSTLGNAS